MRTIKSFCTARISSEINLSVETDLAKPRAAVSSSTQPYASTRGSPFDTRWPYIRDVSPLSPVLVTIDMAILGGILERLGKRVMGFVVAHYFITPLAPEQRCIARIGNLHFSQHLAHDDFDVLVVNLHTLQPIYLLHFIDEVLLQILRSADLEDFMGNDGSFSKLQPLLYEIALKHDNVFVKRA